MLRSLLFQFTGESKTLLYRFTILIYTKWNISSCKKSKKFSTHFQKVNVSVSWILFLSFLPWYFCYFETFEDFHELQTEIWCLMNLEDMKVSLIELSYRGKRKVSMIMFWDAPRCRARGGAFLWTVGSAGGDGGHSTVLPAAPAVCSSGPDCCFDTEA